MTRSIPSAFLMILCALPCMASEPENLIPDSSFEIDADEDGMPDGWTFAWQYTHSNDQERGLKKQKPHVMWDDTVTRSGKHSLFVANERPEDDGVWTLASVPVDGSAKYYKLQVWIKTQSMNGTEALGSAIFLGDKGKWLGANYDAIAVNMDRDWTHYTGYLQPPKGTTSIRIRLWLNMRYTGTGAVWYDDVSLVPTERIVAPIQRYEDDRPTAILTADQRAKGYAFNCGKESGHSHGRTKLVKNNRSQRCLSGLARCRGTRSQGCMRSYATARARSEKRTAFQACE